MLGKIFDIKRYAIHDGPGIRTTVFFKGCSLHCRWCHNPESQSFDEVKMTVKQKLGDRVFEESHVVGYEVSVEQLVKEIAKDYVFFEESGGGVTFSGGEPLMQEDFLLEVLKQCKAKNMHTCIDTAGVAPINRLEEICSNTDLFLYDVKTADKSKFEEFIGMGFDRTIENLKRIAGQGAHIIARIPVIPQFNDDEESMRQIIAVLSDIPQIREVNLLPFHRNGYDKYKRLGMTYGMGHTQSLKEQELEPLKALFRESGFII